MQFKQIERSVEKLMGKISGYASCLTSTPYIDPQYAARFYEILADFFKCDTKAVIQSMSPVGLFSSCINADKDKLQLLRSALWRMCANTELLKRNTAVLPYRRMVFDGEEEVRFTKINGMKGTSSQKLTFVVLTGHFASGTVSVSLSPSSIQHIMCHIGYSGTTRYPISSDPFDIIGLYAKLKIDVFEDGNSCRIANVVDDDSITAYNRKNIISYRVGNVLCPKEAGRSCSECTCTTSECPASYHIAEWYGNQVPRDNDRFYL